MKLKHLVALSAIFAMTFTACTDYQDELDMLEYRMSQLEEAKNRLNLELNALQIIADAVKDADYITDITNSPEGYIIHFHNHGSFLLRHGQDGQDGQDGRNGQDAVAPDISVVKGADGEYYWTLNGQIITIDGEAIRASGKNGRDGQDGQDGVDGKDGKDGVDGKDGKDGKNTVPQIRINENTGEWELSVDDGLTWISTGMGVTGTNGKDGKDGADGKDGIDGKDGRNGVDGQDGRDGLDGRDGRDGKDATSFFESIVVVTSEDGTDYVVFTLKNGTSFRVPMVTTK